ncbi:hypothetical protein Nepgr_014263 [Nepenthes gracilis]|uniref:PH domain-containing protein n=1 Tax=Nepenthes gracilis TaxID=150966 RepID=A0AAD3SKX2_NEPGR|nr:hypothetical protein Nepgr_014263 [Nepenthes gracilis]
MGSGGVRWPSNKLENINEDGPAKCLPASVAPPETPTESMEFLARSWSVSAVELSKALTTTHSKAIEKGSTSFVEGDAEAARSVPSMDTQLKLLSSKTSPISPRGSNQTKELFLLQQALNPDFLSNQQLLKNGLYKSIMKGKTTGRWSKEQREGKKHEIRTHKAQLHAAISVVGVAAAVAALTASHATPSEVSTKQPKVPSKTSAAIASAAALVASHCIEIAEEMGADHQQILAAVNSAINTRTNGDIMTLTAGAATALRGAATLRARLQNGLGEATNALVDEHVEDSKRSTVLTALNFISRGEELLKRTRKGALHWKQVSFHINSTLQMVVKLKSKHIAGAFTKKKKFIVSGVYCDIPAWPAREMEDHNQHKAYFGIQTTDRIIEFECKNKAEKQIWTDGIQHMLNCCVSMT